VTLLTEDNKLFLVEELENDIHPTALKKLLELIVSKSKNNQFVLSTHSHIVLKYLGVVPNSKIFFLDWSPSTLKNGQIENVHTTTIREIENSPEARINLLEKLGYDFYDFELYQAYLILEESSAERVIRDFLIPNFVPFLYNRLKTIASKGVDDLKPRVIDFQRLFVFLHTNPIYKDKVWVVADGDKKGEEVIVDLLNIFQSWGKDHFINFSKANFEEYYPEKFKKKIDGLSGLSHDNKRIFKRELLEEVMDWSLNNRNEAIKAFEKSADEVIKLLRKIEKRLNRQSSQD
jgi:hypothetical protein